MVKLDIARQFYKMINFYSHSARLGSFDFLTSSHTVNDASVIRPFELMSFDKILWF